MAGNDGTTRPEEPRNDDDRDDVAAPQPMTLAGGEARSGGGGETTGQHVRGGREGVTGGSLGSTSDIVEHATPEGTEDEEEERAP